MTSTGTSFRVEHDLIGDRELPNSAYYGVHTLRAVENFPITGVPVSQCTELVCALAAIKKAAALANHALGVLSSARKDAISAACDELLDGKLHDQFVVDVIQGGAGTSTNMNANEVIANRALELMGHTKGEFKHLHPNEHVNFGQSTNDVYPSAIRIALWHMVGQLLADMAHLRQAFAAKADEFADVLKMGRTQLQDAVPMTLGQEFTTFAGMMGDGEQRLTQARQWMCSLNMGGTAIGTGITAHPDFAARVVQELGRITGIELRSAPDLIQATQDCAEFADLSGVLKRVAINLSKISNDLRLLSSGPRAGLGDIILPARQAGSSIMPGKVNPVIPEVVNQVAFEVIGNDVAITLAAEGGQMQLNAFEPLMAWSLFKSIRHLGAACRTLADRCVSGISVNRQQLRDSVTGSIGIVTALNPYIGYANATEVAQAAHASGGSVYDIVLERGLLTRERLDAILQPETLTRPAPLDLPPQA